MQVLNTLPGRLITLICDETFSLPLGFILPFIALDTLVEAITSWQIFQMLQPICVEPHVLCYAV